MDMSFLKTKVNCEKKAKSWLLCASDLKEQL